MPLKATYDREMVTGRELVNTVCFASVSATESNLAVNVNNSSKSDSYNRTTMFTGRRGVLQSQRLLKY